MRRSFANVPVAVLVSVFSVAGTLVLRADPFGDATIPWAGAAAVSLAGNAVLGYLVAGWAAPYLASSGGAAGARQATDHDSAAAQWRIAAVLMTLGLAAMGAVDFMARDPIISPTRRSERNAELVRDTVRSRAPADFRRQLGAADTWRMSDRSYRTCLPSAEDPSRHWCVLVQGDSMNLKVTRYGPGPANDVQFLRWHPEYRGRKRAD